MRALRQPDGKQMSGLGRRPRVVPVNAANGVVMARISQQLALLEQIDEIARLPKSLMNLWVRDVLSGGQSLSAPGLRRARGLSAASSAS